MVKKVSFKWELPDKSWTWEATRYEGNGIFFGKVTSPFVPEGEWGTWYLWEIERNGARLVKGDKAFIVQVKKRSAKTMEVQKSWMDAFRGR
jgi:hypothetical protein